MNVVGGKHRFSKSRNYRRDSVYFHSPALMKHHGVPEENVAGATPHCI